MPSKHKPPSENPGISLGETATRFLSSLTPESASELQQEAFKFIRWYGEERPIISLTGQEVANYCEQFYASTTKSVVHLNAVKTFLGYAFKQGFTSSNLATHIRVKKLPARRASAGTVKAEEPIDLTKDGFEELKLKLAALKEERPRIAEELRRAAADKDFRENAPLEAAREKQGYIEGQIRDIENTVKRARVIESPTEKSLKISMGDTVIVTDRQSGEKINYTLVSSSEANIKQGKISIVSPVGQALFNKEAGDTLEVNTPSGVLTYKIVEIVRN